MKKILIVADDLTGALDSAVTFAERGMRTIVLRHPDALDEALSADPDVMAVATGTRELPAAEASRVAEKRIAPLAQWADIAFKKIDSRLKGHLATEVEIMARLCGLHRALIAPAIPEFGRFVQDGMLTGHGIDQPIDIAARFAGLPLSLQIPAITAADDFTPLLTDLGRTLLVGARGLAAALARALPQGGHQAEPALPPPLLIAIGSRDPITLAQIRAVAGQLPIVPAPNGAIPAELVVSAQALLIQMTAGDKASDSATATARFSANLGEMVQRLAPASIFASGGETADGLLGALGVGSIEVVGEVLPGIPVSRFCHQGQNLTFITKSGGFGRPDTLEVLLRRLAR